MSVKLARARPLSPQRRAAAIGLVVVFAVVVYVFAVRYIDRERSNLRASVATLGAQAHVLEQRALEIERLRAAPQPASSLRPLVDILESEARSAGFAQDALKLEAIGADEVRLNLGATEFAGWLRWVERLQAQRVRVESCRIESLARPGLVSATAVFVRGR